MTRPALAAACLLFAISAAAGPADVIEGRVVGVIDGDTIDVRGDGEPFRVRLAGIDTPERGQPWSQRAKRALSDRVMGRPVRVIEVTRDRWDRLVGEVYADDVCVGCELVREGHAWVYRGFSEDRVLFALEAEARAAERGLWALPESQRTPPWEWRRAARGARATAEERVCGAKARCAEMASCAEARFHLETCGVASLDGDGDGTPCETLCDPR